MTKVLFVCLGNICRSPAAENMMNFLIEREGLTGQIICDSAGTAGYHVGAPPIGGCRRQVRRGAWQWWARRGS